MSHLQRSAMNARIAKLPGYIPDVYTPTIAPGFAAEDETSEEIEEAMSSIGQLQSTAPPKVRNPGARPLRSVDPSDLSEYAPISAANHFTQALSISVDTVGQNLRVYYTPPVTKANESGTVLVCHHGAGYSGLTFACLAKEVTELSKTELGILAFDARRHGKTAPNQGADDVDLSVDTLTNDMLHLLTTIFPDPAQAPSLVLVGHSLGGSVCVRVSPLLQERKYRITGVAVLDIVEGFTLDALPNMMSLLDSRPDGFDSVEEAVKYHITSHAIRNPLSARTSVPSMVMKSASPPAPYEYIWRTPLRSTAEYWGGWFKGLSSKFLTVRAARLLVLAGTDRLDKELMIGQMQGKFQMEVVPDVGHMLHEDNPRRIAEILVEFWKRNERVVIGVKKVGEL